MSKTHAKTHHACWIHPACINEPSHQWYQQPSTTLIISPCSTSASFPIVAFQGLFTWRSSSSELCLCLVAFLTPPLASLLERSCHRVSRQCHHVLRLPLPLHLCAPARLPPTAALGPWSPGDNALLLGLHLGAGRTETGDRQSSQSLISSFRIPSHVFEHVLCSHTIIL